MACCPLLGHDWLSHMTLTLHILDFRYLVLLSPLCEFRKVQKRSTKCFLPDSLRARSTFSRHQVPSEVVHCRSFDKKFVELFLQASSRNVSFLSNWTCPSLPSTFSALGFRSTNSLGLTPKKRHCRNCTTTQLSGDVPENLTLQQIKKLKSENI